MSVVLGSVGIRYAEPADLPSLRRLGALLVRMHHELDPNRFMSVTAETERAYESLLGRQLTDPDVAIFVAEVEGVVVGYVSGALTGYDYLALLAPAGILYDLVVDSASRGRGIGRALLAAIMTELEAKGASRVVLSRAVRNEAAERLFARAGFRPTMVEMTRELGPRVGS